MTTFDNREPLDGWRLPSREPIAPPPRCCGLFAETNVCTVCGNYTTLPALGCE